jgi:3-demethoxyubiquinol 3-hydroxylase
MLSLDQLIIHFDKALKTLFAPAHGTRESPAETIADAPLENGDRTAAGRLMRVNHTGEVCAQALYQGQALTARGDSVRAALEQAAREETDHLAWCEGRLAELNARKSVLNPIFYAGSFALGALSGLLGDKWNLAFLAETERQVEGHLQGHLDRLPRADAKSLAVVTQMKADETRHATTAVMHGAADLPLPVKSAMRLASKAMTLTTHWV